MTAPAPVSSQPSTTATDRARRAARTPFADALKAARARGAAAGPTARAAPRPPPRDAGRRRPADAPREAAPELAARATVEADRRAGETQAVSAASSLRAVVRALPAALEAARVAAGSQLALSFGPALGVELRAGPGGLELTLRPAAALDRAAAAELPGLVAALRARGLTVARAEVRPRADSRPGGGAPSGRAR
jgi:hypothetical protein